MHPRTVVRPPRRTLVGSSSAFHKNALQRSLHARAFTLIELLVVIAIIAILVGLLFPAFKAVLNQAKQTQAKNDLTQIVNAVNAFYTEYGKYPDRHRRHDLLTRAEATTQTRPILCVSFAERAHSGLNTSNASTLARSFSFQSTRCKKPQQVRAVASHDFWQLVTYFDPWGTPYLRRDRRQITAINVANPYTANCRSNAESVHRRNRMVTR